MYKVYENDFHGAKTNFSESRLSPFSDTLLCYLTIDVNVNSSVYIANGTY